VSKSAATSGYDALTGIYFERLNGGGPSVLWIHGGGATGACFRGDLDGDNGWADAVADAGFDCWVTDWPGTGRSGLIDPIDVGYEQVVAGYRSFLRNVIGRPTIVISHSMGGATAWQLVEHERELVVGVIAVASSYPANVAPQAEILSDDGRRVSATFTETGLHVEVDRERYYRYGDGYIELQAYGTSTRLDRSRRREVEARCSGIPPAMILQRIGAVPGLPPVVSTDGFDGMPIKLISGPEDAAHTYEIEKRTIDLLKSWGADATLDWIADRGISGNGHFMFWEDNAAEIGAIVVEHTRSIASHIPE